MGIFESYAGYSTCDGKSEVNMTFLRMENVDLHNKRVLIREDFNVPIKDGHIQNDTRLRRSLPTLQKALQANACVLIVSHLGRPIKGEILSEAEFSLKVVAAHLSKLLNYPVRFESDWLKGVLIHPGEIVLGENVRFNKGEETNDPILAKKMAELCDVFIMDAFAVAHRSHASTVGVAKFSPLAVAGPLLTSELEALSKVLKTPKRPLVTIVAGSKVSTKLSVLKSLIHLVDVLIVGGGIANTFIAAMGYNIGRSLFEPELVNTCQEILKKAKENNIQIIIPSDVVVATEENETARIVNCNQIGLDEKIFDVGPITVQTIEKVLSTAKTILWNGPVGVFEIDAFENGTKALAKAIANSNAFSIVGGGETLAAIDKYGVSDKISYISTGGGAFLEYLEGKTLPAVKVLEERMI